jgi:Flp pilus assembly CpaF family ATPase
MYAEAVGAPGVLATTFRGLLDAGAFSVEQGARLRGFLSDHRTLLVFGDRRSGKSTLLNSLFEFISVDERLVAVENGPDLPALRDRSFCVRLGIDAGTDLTALFEKALRMDPSRLVIGEIRATEVHEFFTLLANSPRIGGMGTLFAGTIEEALAAITAHLGDDGDDARRLIGRVRPVFLHMRRNGSDQPKLVALWSVDGVDRDELALNTIETPSPAGSRLLAEV